jgi:hypothetical protein
MRIGIEQGALHLVTMCCYLILRVEWRRHVCGVHFQYADASCPTQIPSFRASFVLDGIRGNCLCSTTSRTFERFARWKALCTRLLEPRLQLHVRHRCLPTQARCTSHTRVHALRSRYLAGERGMPLVQVAEAHLRADAELQAPPCVHHVGSTQRFFRNQQMTSANPSSKLSLIISLPLDAQEKEDSQRANPQTFMAIDVSPTVTTST